APAASTVSVTAMTRLAIASSVRRPKMTSFSPPAIAATTLLTNALRRSSLDANLAPLHPPATGDLDIMTDAAAEKPTIAWREHAVDWAKTIAGAALAYLAFTTVAFANYRIPSESMVPHLEVGDRVVVSK